MLIDQPIDTPNNSKELILMMTTNELATTFNTTPRTLRKFLRSDASGIASVGKGSRYSIPSNKRELTSLAKRFTAWNDAILAKKAESESTDSESPAFTPEEISEYN